jgi:hypothetical protein
MLVDPKRPKPSADLARIALTAAREADRLEGGKNPAVADTLGRAYFVSGDAKQAAAAQRRAVSLSGGFPAAAPGHQAAAEAIREGGRTLANLDAPLCKPIIIRCSGARPVPRPGRLPLF